MSVTIRLSLTGKRGQPKYRIVVCETRSKRNGRYTDLIGSFDPNLNPPTLKMDQEKFEDWQKKGAIVSTGLSRLIKNTANEKIN